MPSSFSMNSYQGKQILALVRDGDYAHAGEEEAIERALEVLPKDRTRHILDAGCGRGGTAAYMQKRGWGSIAGIDAEPRSIDYARQNFPEPTFLCCDILDVDTHVPDDFDAVTLFNVLYALPDQGAALLALAGRAKAGATLVVFDYVDLGGYRDAQIMVAGQPFLPNPPRKADLGGILQAGSWRLQSAEDLTADYARWYQELVDKIEAKHAAIEALAGADAYEHVLDRYAGLLSAIKEGRLGGAVIHGEKAGAAL